MNPANHQIHSKEFRGMERSYYAMPFAERYIWGATAGILRVLYERIYLAMIRPAIDRNRNFPDPVRGLCAVPDRDPLRRAGASRPGRLHLVAKLVLGSLLLVVVSFVLLAHFSGAPPNSTYIPAHIENGKFVPGVEK